LRQPVPGVPAADPVHLARSAPVAGVPADDPASRRRRRAACADCLPARYEKVGL